MDNTGNTIMHRLAAVTAFLFVFTALPALYAEESKPPNFVVVFIDDLGYGDFGCYGSDEVTTPEIDRMAAEGLRFERFYVAAPICSPSRVGISTGQFPARWGITSYLADRQKNRERGMKQFLSRKAPMLARELHRAGYATGHFGKWHMGGQRDVGNVPLITEYGFDESLTQFEGLGERVLGTFETLYQDNGGKRGLELGSEQLRRGEVHWIPRYEITKAFADRAIQFIDKSEGKPFYINVWPDDVHGPWEPPPELRGDDSKRGKYLGALQNMDAQLGPLFEHIRGDAELRDNTVVIVTSDNGPERGAGTNGPLRGFKGKLYEGGIREPMIVWAPGMMPAERVGQVDKTSVIGAVDFFPSFLAMAGVEPPEGVTPDGIDRSDALLGREEAKDRETPLIWVRPPDHPGRMGDDFPDLAVMDGKWKLLVETDGSAPQLYDVSTDPGETNNVAGERTEVVQRMTDVATAFHKEVNKKSGE